MLNMLPTSRATSLPQVTIRSNLEIVENNIRNLLKRDIKPLQIVVLSRF
jgi:hypothetical protein